MYIDTQYYSAFSGIFDCSSNFPEAHFARSLVRKERMTLLCSSNQSFVTNHICRSPLIHLRAGSVQQKDLQQKFFLQEIIRVSAIFMEYSHSFKAIPELYFVHEPCWVWKAACPRPCSRSCLCSCSAASFLCAVLVSLWQAVSTGLWSSARVLHGVDPLGGVRPAAGASAWGCCSCWFRFRFS